MKKFPPQIITRLFLVLTFVLLLVIVIIPVPKTAHAQQSCAVELNFLHYPGGQGPATVYSTDSVVQIRAGDTFSLSYRIANGQQQCFGVYQYRLLYTKQNGGSGQLTSGNTGGQIVEDEYQLGTPAAGEVYAYTIQITNTNNFNNPVASKDIGIAFTDGTGNPVPPASTELTLTEVKVCQLDKTTATICWKTNKASNSEVEYGVNSTTEQTKRFTNFTLLTHSVPLTGLKAGTAYKYKARSSPDANTTSTKSEELTFTTKNADGTGGNTGGTGGSGPTAINTKVGLDKIPNFDEKIGDLFNPLDKNMTSPAQIIVRLINIALFLVGILAVIFIIAGGFLMITSAGNENRLKQGKQTLIWAVAGLILSLLSFSIVAIVQSIIS